MVVIATSTYFNWTLSLFKKQSLALATPLQRKRHKTVTALRIYGGDVAWCVPASKVCTRGALTTGPLKQLFSTIMRGKSTANYKDMARMATES